MLSRRGFLAGVGASVAVGFHGISFARAPVDRRLVVLILRGAMDGLAVIPPHGDADYARARGPLAIPGPGEGGGMLDLDGFYGLNPGLSALMPLWNAKELAFVHAVATPYRERSHFDAQDLLENGTDTPHATPDGWLDRALLAMGADAPRSIAIGQGLPLVLRGKANTTSVDPLDTHQPDDDFLAQVDALYHRDDVLGPAFDDAMAARRMVDASGEMPSGDGGKRGNARAEAEATGKLLAGPGGPRVAVLEATGWDTHTGEGTSTGTLATRLGTLAEALLAMKASLGADWSTTAVVAVTEFGRTVHGNGTSGSDHGTGAVAWLAGGAIAGGKVHGQWPGLGAGKLYQDRDLMPTTDLRAVLKGLLRDHLGVDEGQLATSVFPASKAVTPMAALTRA